MISWLIFMLEIANSYLFHLFLDILATQIGSSILTFLNRSIRGCFCKHYQDDVFAKPIFQLTEHH